MSRSAQTFPPRRCSQTSAQSGKESQFDAQNATRFLSQHPFAKQRLLRVPALAWPLISQEVTYFCVAKNDSMIFASCRTCSGDVRKTAIGSEFPDLQSSCNSYVTSGGTRLAISFAKRKKYSGASAGEPEYLKKTYAGRSRPPWQESTVKMCSSRFSAITSGAIASSTTALTLIGTVWCILPD